MAKVKRELPEAASLYDRDFFGWTQQQAGLLRREARLQPGTDLDLENLAEEIESLGKRDRRALTNNVARIAEHLLKLQYSPAKDPRPGSENPVDVHRTKARKILADSPGLRSDLQDMLSESYGDGRRRAVRALRGEVDPTVLPERCSYTVDQMLDQDWWP
jgi:Domain of unknown function DUF29